MLRNCVYLWTVILLLQPSMFTQFHAEGLSPYVEYIFNIAATNEFTEFSFGETSAFGRPSRFRTLEGGMHVCVYVCVYVCACVRVCVRAWMCL